MVTPKMITLYRQISLISLNHYFQLRFRIVLEMKHFQNFSSKNFMNLPYEIRIKWITKKVKQLFKLKSTNPYPSCVIYEGVCVCEQTYISKKRRTWEEHENTSKNFEPAKHLKENLSHKFSWKILFAAPENKRICKILETAFKQSN